MKKMNFFHSALVALALAASFASCSKDDNVDSPSTPDPIDPVSNVHYDLTVTIGTHGGMNKDTNGHIDMSVGSLSDASTTLDFKGNGCEITEYTIENMYGGKYKYQVPNSEDRFSKLQFKDNQLQVIQEQKFGQNKFKKRQYTYAWIDSKTLVVMAAAGVENSDKILWTKLDAETMKILGEGELSLTLAEGFKKFSTTGILTYRKSDNKLIYFFFSQNSKKSREKNFHTAIINPATMVVERDTPNKEAAEMQGSAYGELMQSIVFFDENDNLYLSAFNTVSSQTIGCVIRIKKGEYDFEAGYNAFPDAKGKIMTIQYLGNDKALTYSADNDATDDFTSYYSIIDLKNKTSKRLQFEGKDIPYNSGTFSQRTAVNTTENKAYIGVNTSTEQCIYVYDIATGAVTKGLSIAPGYYFDQLRIVEN